LEHTSILTDIFCNSNQPIFSICDSRIESLNNTLKFFNFLTVLSAQGTDALKNDALFPELLLLDTLYCPKMIAVFDGPY
jgi:hypothetical protein